MRRGAKSGLVVLAAILGLAASSCGNGVIDKSTDGLPPAEATGTLRVLIPSFPPSTKGRAEFDKVVADFHRTYPKMKVEPDFATYATLNEKMSTSIAAGIPYDVMVTGVGWIQPFASKRIFADLAPYGVTPQVIEEKSIGALVPAATYDGKLYAYPLVADARAAALRISAFKEAGLDPDKPPKSLDELKAAAEKLTVKNAKGTITRSGFDMAAATSFRQTYTTLLASTGTNLYVDGQPNYSNEKGLETLNLLKSMANHVQPYGQQNAAQQPLVLTGEAAMGIVGGAVDCSDKGVGKKNCDDLKFFRFDSGKEVEFVGGDLASIGSRSRHKEAAWSFIQSLTKPSSLDAIAKLNKKLPAYKDAANSPQAKSNPLSKFVAEGLPLAIYEGGSANWLEMRANFDSQLTQAVLGQKDPAKVLANLAGQSR
ncbi:carbohydrate ABC transporter substrate-binding protein (CUT1 family) [Kribbella voronezhensis]|uniref:Carbohydrate ABC transporter substrate-binding protein (CUT1 family) n=1 Tax=Kribbella voronezhensis TaxID=2512212 RepID=A0A4R7TCM1_9ACTN|nr:extracellular solute-binding protein [Kribbella voronezhensis]TDU89479.1 carbohydrate ABC transporter substrate-binding protein (CUT1 family) [Kribbella voronezhensis]